jgi:hypothetical protein
MSRATSKLCRSMATGSSLTWQRLTWRN